MYKKYYWVKMASNPPLSFIDYVEELRYSIKSHLHIFETITSDTSTLTNFDANLYWGCISLVLKNFIEALTLGDESFTNLRKEYNFHDFTKKDMFKSSSKWLKIVSCSYDLIHIQNGKKPHRNTKFYYINEKMHMKLFAFFLEMRFFDIKD